MSKKAKHEEHENHERWLVSYADFMTLLFAFFTSMYAISNLDLQKAGRLVMSTRAAFNSPVMSGGASILPVNPTGPPAAQALLVPPLTIDGEPFTARREIIEPEAASASTGSASAAAAPVETGSAGATAEACRKAQQGPLDAYFADLESRLTEQLDARGFQGSFSLHQRGNELWLTMPEAILFESGRADLRMESSSGLDGIADVLASIPEPLRIEGHTDSLAIRTTRFPSNWELSTARATAILRYLSDHHGIEPARLAAAGYGPYRPAAPNTTAAGRAANRRVELVVVADPVRLATAALGEERL